MAIVKIVITGGPCAGKTTGMNYLREKLADLGFKVFVSRELATDLIASGFDPRTASKEKIIAFEEVLLKGQLAIEKMLLRLAAMYDTEEKDVVVLFDRGAMDVQAYLELEEFQAVLDDNHLNVVALRDGRYDAVIHMTTAAKGAVESYTCDNNSSRIETPKEAVAACDRTLSAWVGHPHLRVIGNSSDFEGKVRRVLQEVCQVLAIPVPIEREHKFLVSAYDLSSIDFQEIDIEQVYLSTAEPGTEERVRKRGQDGHYVYYRTRKKDTGDPTVRHEVEWQIDGRQYVNAIRNDADPDRQPVVKKRTCFIWDDAYYELDDIERPSRHAGLVLLEVERTDANDRLVVPPFITVEREVTGEKAFTNSSLALC